MGITEDDLKYDAKRPIIVVIIVVILLIILWALWPVIMLTILGESDNTEPSERLNDGFMLIGLFLNLL